MLNKIKRLAEKYGIFYCLRRGVGRYADGTEALISIGASELAISVEPVHGASDRREIEYALLFTHENGFNRNFRLTCSHWI